MAESNKPERPPLDWRRILPLALAVGVGPAIGRDVSAGQRESWGYWPAFLAGIAAAAISALAVYGVVWLVAHRRGGRPDA